MVRQFPLDVVAVRQFAAIAHAMHQNDLLESLVDLRILDETHERRESGAGTQQVQALAGLQIVQQQRSGRLAADEHFIARLYML